MTIIDEILIAANKIANTGKKPTLAMVKAKLTSKVPLPTLINTLKTWQHDASFISVKEDKRSGNIHIKVDSKDEGSLTEKNAILIKALVKESLAEELLLVQQELAEIKALVNKLLAKQ